MVNRVLTYSCNDLLFFSCVLSFGATYKIIRFDRAVSLEIKIAAGARVKVEMKEPRILQLLSERHDLLSSAVPWLPSIGGHAIRGSAVHRLIRAIYSCESWNLYLTKPLGHAVVFRDLCMELKLHCKRQK